MSNSQIQSQSRKILVGNTFPFPLIQRAVRITPEKSLPEGTICSYWGHDETLDAAKEFLGGRSVVPARNRPALCVSSDGFPMLDGEIFTECWVVAPQYVPNYRPTLYQPVPPEKITAWKVLRIDFTDEASSASLVEP